MVLSKTSRPVVLIGTSFPLGLARNQAAVHGDVPALGFFDTACLHVDTTDCARPDSEQPRSPTLVRVSARARERTCARRYCGSRIGPSQVTGLLAWGDTSRSCVASPCRRGRSGARLRMQEIQGHRSNRL